MAKPIEQKLVERALVLLAAINGMGDYHTTLGTTMRGNASGPSIGDSVNQWQQDEQPALSVFQQIVEVTGSDDEGIRVERRLPLVVRGFVEQGLTAENARNFVADIMRALRVAGDSWTVSGTQLAQRTEEGPHEIIYTESYEIVGVVVNVNIYYFANHLDMET